MLDTKFSHAFEDVDFCFRAKKHQFHVVYVPNANFFHGDGTTANKNLALKHYFWYQGKLRFAIKDLSLFNALSIFIFQSLAIMFKITRGKNYSPLIYIKAVYWNIKHLKETLSYKN